MATNHTHDPSLRSWVTAANEPDALFPIQNLPFGVVRRAGSGEALRVAVAIGDCALDLTALDDAGIAPSVALRACRSSDLNAFMALGKTDWTRLRSDLSGLLSADSSLQSAVVRCLIPLAEVEYGLPATVGDYTDFYASIHHATNIGKLFRPDQPLLPNYQWVPIGYHGRSSSIGVSGQRFARPVGQIKVPDADVPVVEPCRRLDYELEVGVFVGRANDLGEPVAIDQAEDHIFGCCLLNDWSARDVQAWEYQPLGPFLAKSFASTISPWIVTMEALAPFRAEFSRNPEHPQPLPYLSSAANSASGALDIQLEVLLLTERMRQAGHAPHHLSSSNFADSYWTAAQLLTHHTMNGCNLRPGDLFGSGTMSGPMPGSQGALIEITNGGTVPMTLPNGEVRTFLEDGDTVLMRAFCKRDGWVGLGFGEVVGTVLPARGTPS